MRKARIAHVITRLSAGGAQENTFHTVRLADRDRYEVDLIAGPPTGAEGHIENAVRAAGIPIHREETLVRMPSLINDLKARWNLIHRFRERRYDIVHTHTSKAGIIGRIAASRAGVPHIVHTPHGNIFQGYFSAPVTAAFVAMERYAARRTDRIIELTAGGIEEHLALGIGRREQYRVIFSGIDLAPYETARAQRDATREALNIPPGAIAVGGVGRLERIKGFTYFVEAARQLGDRLPEMLFFHAGDGALADSLTRDAAPLGDRFRFLGRRGDVPMLMAAFDLLVVPSINEGMGRVVLEAGAAGTPVVASRVGGLPDVVDDGVTGQLVPAQDPRALADAIAGFAEDAEGRVRMGAAARAKVVPHYGLENMVRQIEALYEDLLDEDPTDRRG